MLDFALGVLIAGLLVRGWLRGLVREVLDLVGLVAGLWLAFRLSGPVGEFLDERFGFGPETSGIAAGVGVFLLLGLVLSVAAHYLGKVMRLPALGLANRLGGAVVATLWGVSLIVVGVNLMRTADTPDWVDQTLAGSGVVETITGPGSAFQEVFERFGSDTLLGALAVLRSTLGEERVAPEGDEVVMIPPASEEEVRQVRDEAALLLELVNQHRVGLGLRPMEESGAISAVAESRAVLMYTSGRVSRDNPPGESVIDDLARAGVRVVSAAENPVLASSARAAFGAMLDSPTGQAHVETGSFDRAGVAVVEGPSGFLYLLVLAS